MLNYKFVTNDTEESFVYEQDGETQVNISRLVAAGDDPECLCIAKWKDRQDEPIVQIKLYEEEQELLKKLLFS